MQIIKSLNAEMSEELKNDTDFQLALSAILTKYNDEMVAALGKLTY